MPAGHPARLTVGLTEMGGKTWMKSSGVKWDVRYIYLTYGWADNWGWGAKDGSYAANYMNESRGQSTIPAFSFYEIFAMPGGGEPQTLQKAQNGALMNQYFTDFKVLMQRAKEFGQPVIVMIEPDASAFLQQQSGNNPNTYAAIAHSGMPELAGLPNTVAGWGQAFLQLKKTTGANNVILGLHVSQWTTGAELFYNQLNENLQQHVDRGYAFLSTFGLTNNVTGLTYDVMVTDPLDRDADFYRTTQNRAGWWDMNDNGPTNGVANFNRYAEWLRLWNLKAGKRWVMWQIPVGNASNGNWCNNGYGNGGYKDNRTEYFFGNNGAAHREKFASAGVISLMFGAGETCQATHETDGNYMKNNAGPFLNAGGLAIPTGSGNGSSAPAPAPSPAPTTPTAPSAPTGALSSMANASPSTVQVNGKTTLTATINNPNAAISNAGIDVEVHNSSGTMVAQTFCQNVNIPQGGTGSCSYDFTPTTAGTYTVKVGLFNASWALLHWNNGATTVTATAAAAATPSDNAKYGFEAGTQGWTVVGGPVKSATSSTAKPFAGSRSLAVAMNGSAGVVTAQVANPTAGGTVTAKIWVPANTVNSISLFSQDKGTWAYRGTYLSASQLTPNAWNTVTLSTSSSLQNLGVSIDVKQGGTGTVYIDSVN